MSLTLKESAFASRLGRVLDNQLPGLLATCFWYGMFMLLMLISVVVKIQRTRRREDKTWTHNILFGATVFSFITSSIYVASRLTAFRLLMDSLLAAGGEETFTELAARLLRRQNVLVCWVAYLPTLIIDATIIWGARAMCIVKFPDKLGIITFPCILWFGTFATILAYVTWLCTSSGYNLYILSGPRINDLLVAGVTLSNATNLTATLLFSWTLWLLRKEKEIKFPTQTRMFVTLLIESGSVYFTVQLVYLGFLIKSPPGTVALEFWVIFAPTYTMFSAMYPTILTILKVLKPSTEAVIAGCKPPTLYSTGGVDIELEELSSDSAHAHNYIPPQCSPPLEISFVTISRSV